MRRTETTTRVRSAAVVMLFTTALVAAAGLNAWAGSIEGDPFRGRILLAEKSCVRCHSVWGHGGLLGPEMSSAVAGKSWLDLVGSFWNHTPRMIDAMLDGGYSWPKLDRDEMADLLSYLYYLRLFDEPGSPDRGEISFSRLRCVTCHTLGGEGGTDGGPLDRFSSYPSPVVLAQAMWNAGPKMRTAQMGRWSAISTFTRGEMADIQAYIRARALRADRTVELLPLPDPQRGALVFREKRCSSCHRPGGSDGPDLGASALGKTVSEIGGMLWNHSYAMSDWMQQRGIPFPRFQGTELSDLISYLYFLGFVGEPGDDERGVKVFAARGCASCHGAPDGRAPSLQQTDAARDPIALSAAMWNHAPEMHELMAEQQVAWPAFEPGDMRDLAAFLERSAGER